MKKIALLLSVIGFALFVPASAFAQTATVGTLVGDACDENDITVATSSLCSDASKNESAEKFLKNVINVLLMAVGILAVIMIIVSAIKYTTSRGDSAMLTSAKNTLLYSVIGLAVAVLSFAIVELVLKEVTPPPASPPPASGSGESRSDPRTDKVAE